jgi:hypothetical protein
MDDARLPLKHSHISQEFFVIDQNDSAKNLKTIKFHCLGKGISGVKDFLVERRHAEFILENEFVEEHKHF